jgi:hypothetical protein
LGALYTVFVRRGRPEVVFLAASVSFKVRERERFADMFGRDVVSLELLSCFRCCLERWAGTRSCTCMNWWQTRVGMSRNEMSGSKPHPAQLPFI